MALHKGKSEAWQLGYDAYWAEDSILDCPFDEDRKIKEWKSGWYCAENEGQ